MKGRWWYEFGLATFLVILSVAFFVPTAFKLDKDSGYPIKSKINLGLDLQGGLYMILGVDFPKAYRDEIKNYGQRIRDHLSDENIKTEMGDLDISDPNDPKQSITIIDSANMESSRQKVAQYFRQAVRLTSEKGNVLQYGLDRIVRTQMEEQSVAKSIEVIRNRIDEFGVTEPEIVSQGKDRILVQLPGVKDIERAKELIGRTAKLEFRLVNDSIAEPTLQEWVTKGKAAGIEYKAHEKFLPYVTKLNDYLTTEKLLPAGYELAFERKLSKVTSEIQDLQPYLIVSATNLSGDDLQDARVQYDNQKGEPYVSLNFKAQGADKFEKLTGDNIGKKMAILLDGNIYSAPVIQGRIGGGRAQITMGMGDPQTQMKNARDIALVLRAGALPVQIDFLEQRVVGPSLGKDSINKAQVAGLVGCLLVFLFAMIYYRISGVIAVFGLCLNVLFILAALVGLEATLTLPGLAGIALTVGMAVDGNIIIYERIREEIHAGANGFKAMEAGFGHAFWTLIDANATTAVAGFFLLQFGTGPIRGFAVTLLIGIASTVYTAFYVSRLMFEFYMARTHGKSLSI